MGIGGVVAGQLHLAPPGRERCRRPHFRKFQFLENRGSLRLKRRALTPQAQQRARLRSYYRLLGCRERKTMGLNHTYKIVLADDHALVRRGIKKIIEENNGMKVIGEAGDGLELLEILEKIHPELVVVDIAMPRLRGLEAARRVKNLYPE